VTGHAPPAGLSLPEPRLELVTRVVVRLEAPRSLGQTRWGPRETLARIFRGELVDPSEYYFRIAAQLETGAPAYTWVNQRLFVGSAARSVDAVVYDLFEVG